jgi:putative ABC transport system permease protein
MRRAALAFYRVAAAAVLPSAFREEFGRELEHAVAARLAASRTVIAAGLVLLAELADLMRTAAREWRAALGWGRDPRSTHIGRREAGMGGGWSDLRTTVRSLSRRPGLALAVALTMGLGIGATTTIYSVVDGVILRPLPYPGSLVAIGSLSPGSGDVDPATGLERLEEINSPVLAGLQERARSYDWIGAICPYQILIADDNDVQDLVRAAMVSPELLPTLGAAPVLGRTFLPEEHSIQGEPVVMITYDFWQTRFGGDPDVLGRPLGTAVTADSPRPTIVGVLQRGSRLPEAFFSEGEEPQVLAPLPVVPANSDLLLRFRVFGVGRLGRSATPEQARDEAHRIAEELTNELGALAEMPGGRPATIGVNDLHDQTVGGAARSLWVFLGAAGLLLVLTAMNGATLFLARALDRRHELGVRLALGASRSRVARLLVGEAAILSLVGGALGVALAYGGVALFLSFAPNSIPRLSDVAIDGRALGVAAAGTLAAAFVVGVLSAFKVTGSGSWQQLQSGGRSVSEGASALRTVLVGGQVALAVVLLCGAGLLFTSFMRIRGADVAFDPVGLIAVRPAPQGSVEGGGSDVPGLRRWDPVLDALGSVAGVESVGAASNLPFQTPAWAPSISLPGDGPDVVREDIAGYVISPAYLKTVGTPVLQGRGLEANDGPDAEPVALVNEAFVRTQLDGRDAVGEIVRRRVEAPFRAPSDKAAGQVNRDVAMRIVGVVPDVVQGRTEDGARAAIYIPYGQADSRQLVSFWTVVRTDLPADVVGPELRAVVSQHGRVPMDMGTMTDRASIARGTPRFQAMLIGAFAIVALLLAALGLHGSLAHNVRRRQRELGVRMALGADRASVLRMVVGQGMRVAAVGLLLGLVGTLALARVLASFLFGMKPYDPLTLAGMAVVLLLVSLTACLAPAHRATSVDPVRVLQGE